MSTPAASTKSVNSTSPEAQNATSKDISTSSPQRTSTTHSQQPTNGDAITTTTNGTEAGQGGEGEQGQGGEGAEGLDEEGYPPQKHAGAIGLGPEYGKMREATAGDKIAGLKDELVGKVTRNQDKVQHGHEQRTGELKRKKFEEESSADPFNADDDSNTKDPAPAQSTTGSGSGNTSGNADNSGSSSIPGNQAPTSVTGKRGAGTHPTEAGAQEQAATTAPEGTEDAERQRDGGNVEGDRQVDEGREGREEGREAKKLRAE